MIQRLAKAIDDQRHRPYIDYAMRDLLAQRIFQIACGIAHSRR